jgi:PD-(D/E)XK nuclease superfamily/Phage integrase SAM-like domain
MPSIFSLGRGDSLQETYLTKVFAFALNEVREYTKIVLQCAFSCDLGNCEIDCVKWEFQTGGERPDIVIEVNDRRKIAIENKIGACFTEEQISRYKKKYDSVFLVYRYISNIEQAKIADESSSWYNVYSETKNFLENPPMKINEVDQYLLKEFKKFLEENSMAIEPVKNNIMEGLCSLKNLYSEITASFEELKLSKGIKNDSQSSTPFYTNWVLMDKKQSRIQCCLLYHPLRLFTYYEPSQGDLIVDDNMITKKYPDIISDLGWRGIWYIISEFQFDGEFFQLPTEKQIARIGKFLCGSFATLQVAGRREES